MQKRISIVLVEDEDLVRAWLRPILEESGFDVVGEATSARAGVEAALREQPDLCLIDIGLPDEDGIAVVRQLSRQMPETALVVFSASDGHDELIEAIRAGAAGYLLKEMDPQRLTHALRGVVGGEAAIPRPLMAALVKELQTHGRRKALIGLGSRVELTRRQWEVLEMMCEQLTTGEIAERLSLSPVTVRRHISEVVRKLGVADRDGAVALVEGRL